MRLSGVEPNRRGHKIDPQSQCCPLATTQMELVVILSTNHVTQHTVLGNVNRFAF